MEMGREYISMAVHLCIFVFHRTSTSFLSQRSSYESHYRIAYQMPNDFVRQRPCVKDAARRVPLILADLGAKQTIVRAETSHSNEARKPSGALASGSPLLRSGERVPTRQL
jgi:hypothetical protein